jgi:hypothetical protein
MACHSNETIVAFWFGEGILTSTRHSVVGAGDGGLDGLGEGGLDGAGEGGLDGAGEGGLDGARVGGLEILLTSWTNRDQYPSSSWRA